MCARGLGPKGLAFASPTLPFSVSLSSCLFHLAPISLPISFSGIPGFVSSLSLAAYRVLWVTLSLAVLYSSSSSSWFFFFFFYCCFWVMSVVQANREKELVMWYGQDVRRESILIACSDALLLLLFLFLIGTRVVTTTWQSKVERVLLSIRCLDRILSIEMNYKAILFIPLAQ